MICQLNVRVCACARVYIGVHVCVSTHICLSSDVRKSYWWLKKAGQHSGAVHQNQDYDCNSHGHGPSVVSVQS